MTETRTDTLVDAINYLLSREGAAGLSLRAIARVSRVSTSSMLHHFGSREQLVRVAAARTGRARVEVIERRAAAEGVAAFLPNDDDEEDLITARAWLAWNELGRCAPELRTSISRCRDNEYLLLARILGVPVRSRSLVSLMALIDGLLVALCEPEHPLSPADARQILLARVASEDLSSTG